MDNDIMEHKGSDKALKNLEIMSIDALNEYIADLDEEIRRVRAVISEKEAALHLAWLYYP